MAKELYLYSPIYDFTIAPLLASIEENMGSEVTLRINSPGGSVFSMYGLCAKMQEHGEVSLKVDGSAMSSAAYACLFASNVECLDVTSFLFHRADMYVGDDADQEFLDKINTSLKAKMLAKIDADKFKSITGYTIEDLFNPDSRIDVTLDAKQAKAIGLVNKIVKLTPAEATAYASRFAVAATASTTPQPQKNQNMTAEQFKAAHPEAYAQIFTAGKTDERDRVTALLEYNDIDPVAVAKYVKEGTEPTRAIMAEFNRKALSKEGLTALKKENAPDVTTPPTELSAEEKKKLADAKAEADFLAEAGFKKVEA